MMVPMGFSVSARVSLNRWREAVGRLESIPRLTTACGAQLFSLLSKLVETYKYMSHPNNLKNAASSLREPGAFSPCNIYDLAISKLDLCS